MKTLMHLLLATTLAFSISGCSDDKNDKVKDGNAADIDAESTAIQTAENELAQMGLRFDVDYVNSKVTWEPNALNAGMASTSATDAKAGLQKFITLTQNFLDKYSGKVNVKHPDGTSEVMTMLPEVREVYQAKINLARETITKL